MLVGIALFVCDSMHLSNEALVFPAVLIVVILAAQSPGRSRHMSLKGAGDGRQARCRRGEDDERRSDPRCNTVAAGRAAGGPAVALFDYLGVLTALVLLVFGGQAIFGSALAACRAC